MSTCTGERARRQNSDVGPQTATGSQFAAQRDPRNPPMVPEDRRPTRRNVNSLATYSHSNTSSRFIIQLILLPQEWRTASAEFTASDLGLRKNPAGLFEANELEDPQALRFHFKQIAEFERAWAPRSSK